MQKNDVIPFHQLRCVKKPMKATQHVEQHVHLHVKNQFKTFVQNNVLRDASVMLVMSAIIKEIVFS